MSNPVQRSPGNDAFGGGALIRGPPPPDRRAHCPAPTPARRWAAFLHALSRAQLGHEHPHPVQSRRAALRPARRRSKAVVKPDGNNASSPEGGTHMHADTQSKTLMSETTRCATRIAFVLAKKSNVGITSQTADEDALRDFSYAINSAIATCFPEHQKLQKLCSLEYLQRYVTRSPAKGAIIDLGARPTDANANDPRPREGGVPPLSNNKLKEWPEVRTSRRRLPGGVAARTQVSPGTPRLPPTKVLKTSTPTKCANRTKAWSLRLRPMPQPPWTSF